MVATWGGAPDERRTYKRTNIQAAGTVGPGRRRLPRHMMPFNSRNECSKRVLMTWWVRSIRPGGTAWDIGTDWTGADGNVGYLRGYSGAAGQALCEYDEVGDVNAEVGQCRLTLRNPR